MGDAAYLFACALAICVWVCSKRYALIKASLVFLGLQIPLKGLTLSMLCVGLFGPVSLLSLGLCTHALLNYYTHQEILPLKAAWFLTLFEGFIFIDTLGFLPFSLIYAPYKITLISLCLFSLCAFILYKPLGMLFLGVLALLLLDRLCSLHFPVLYVAFMDIYLWIVALVRILVAFIK
ncbi:hypothetical protein [Helicobacter suis]|uniref:Uncharacterized protein n=1 Tax=Helicobacter suis TaxID=104628 RepID=A0A6J4CX31_9HELI|nr:hypothetical protein [Helicobacter suis]BCD48009.1 hypothetical protein NHP194003_12130 [Helicobacter suis]BCD49769.1 hypothetical protein NHP194004_12160 [Helicobacter suis]BCD70068.1 hypothetical protein SNTW_07130 [Helicobacter suis]BDR28264.1 hypothetical protein HSHS1_10250 [Helicobacter suis HS1]